VTLGFDFSHVILVPTHMHFVFCPFCAFMTEKFFSFYFFRVFFFFKVITEQVVVDANLPSVSKESVGQVGPGGGDHPTPSRARAGSGVQRAGDAGGCRQGEGDVSVCWVSGMEGWEGGTGVKLQKKKKKKEP
jgi:hypothetical protein